MSKAPIWFRRLLVGGVSTLTVGGLGMTGLLSAAGTASATPAFKITQLAGSDRFGTAAAIATAAFPNGAVTVIVASGLDTNLPDALAASYLAAQQTNGAGKGAPILLVNSDSVPAATASAIATLKPTNIIVVGGTSSVTASVATTLSNGGTIKVTRVAGANRFLTADAIDSQTGFENVGTIGTKKTAIIADGVDANLVDALGASPLEYAGPYPMFLVNGATGTLSSADLGIMATDGITNAIIVGGTAAVGSQVSSQLTGAGITNVTEGGTDRSATSDVLANYEIANAGFSKGITFDIAGGGQPNLVDALAGGPLGGIDKAPTLITDSSNNPASVVTFAAANEPTLTAANLFGGSDAVDATAEAAILAAGNTPPSAATAPPVLSSASITGTTASGTTVQYVFNENLTGAALVSVDFHVYASTAAATEYSDGVATLDGTNLDAVDVTYPDAALQTGGTGVSTLALATVSSGAVTPAAPVPPATTVIGPNPDGAASIGTGTVQAPLLTSIGITPIATTPATYEGQYTFSEPVATSVVASKLHLYDANGTELTCATAAPATTNGTTGPAVINCTVYDVGATASGTAATALQVSTATLGTADAGAVTGAGSPDTTPNPEGAQGHF